MEDEEKTTPPDPDVHVIAVTTKPAWYKNKRLLLILVPVLLLGIGALVYFLVLDKAATNKPAANNSQSKSTASNIQKSGKYQDDGIDGITFAIPEGWWVKRVSTGGTFDGYTLYSPDSVAVDDYNGISAGTSIRIRSYPRDPVAESKVDKPVEAYISLIGGPVVNEEARYSNDAQVDKTKLKYVTNKNKAELLAYRWAYEGCHVAVLLLGDDTYYTFNVIKGDACPETGVLETDKTVAAFFDSVKLSAGDSKVIGDTFMYQDNGKEASSYEVRAPGIAFAFSLFTHDTPSLTISGGDPSVQIKNGLFDTLTLGPAREANAKTYGCDGCGFAAGTYDSIIQFSKKKIDTTGYQKIKDGLFGKVESVPPIQKDAEANDYEYVKELKEGSMVVHFAIEVSDGTPLPSLEADFIIKSLDSLKTL